MHEAVAEYVGRFASEEVLDVLDIGGRSVNGTPRGFFPQARFTVLDVRPGDDVDIVADATVWKPSEVWDLVLCTEVFEHTSEFPKICRTAFNACRPGGRIIVTCAGPGRAPHSAFIEAEPQPGEHYCNLLASDLVLALCRAGWAEVMLEQVGLDLRATGRRPT